MRGTTAPIRHDRNGGSDATRRPRVALAPLDAEDVATRALVRDLGAGGLDVDVVAGPPEAGDLPSGADALLVDVDPVSGAGWACAEAARNDVPAVPLLVRMVGEDVDATLRGFDLGAEDVLPHSTASAEVLARIGVVMRRHRADGVIRYGDLVIDFTARAAFLGDRPLDVSGLQFDVLAVLARHPDRVWTRRELDGRGRRRGPRPRGAWTCASATCGSRWATTCGTPRSSRPCAAAATGGSGPARR
jgi:DNA-binding response OmpR family regulator